MADHTLGPWELHAETHGSNSLRICKPANNERGCIAVAEAEILGMPRLEAEANARFIVLAVNAHEDLLAAAMEAESWLASSLTEFNRLTAWADVKHAREILRAAIAKAKGA